MRTAWRVVHHVVDCAEDPARSGCRIPDSQSGRFAREADAVAHDKLRATSGAGAEGFAFVEVGDFGVFLVGEVVPAVADIGEFRVDEFFEDIAVEEDVTGGLDVEGLCVSGGMLATGVWGWAYLSTSAFLELVEILDLVRCEVVECYCGEAPWLAVESLGELVQFSDVGVLQDRPGVAQGNTGVGENLAQDTVASPVPVGVLVQFYSAGRVLVRGELHRGVGDNEAGPAMRKDDVCDLGLSADVVGFFRIEMREPFEECRPREIGICLHEDIPFGVILVGEGLLHHGKEFPLVELPARIIRFADIGIGFIGEVG